MLTCAGTGGLEAAVVNTLSPGDAVLGGHDRRRSATGSRRSPDVYGADGRPSSRSSGARPPTPAAVRDGSRRDPGLKAVLLTHNETSTGVMNPIADARRRGPGRRAGRADPRRQRVSALGAVPFEMDAWGVDLVVTGSQKAWMAAPGLAMVAASDRAPGPRCETATMPRFYLDLRAHRDTAADRRDAVDARRSRSSTRSTRASA